MNSPADYVIEKFGSLRKTADALGLTHSVVQGWQIRRRVPQWHWDAIIAAAADKGETIAIEDFLKDHPKKEIAQ